MAANSKIQWTHHTFNPWRGCTKVSDGCKFCYADKLSERNPKSLGVWGANGTRVIAAEAYWRDPIKWNDWASRGICHACGGKGEFKHKDVMVGCADCQGTGLTGEPYRARVFCASLADVFEGDETMPKDSWAEVRRARLRLFDLIRRTPNLDWLLLTKRSENIQRLITQAALDSQPGDTCEMLNGWIKGGAPENVWIGTSVENQKTAGDRIEHLLKVPAAVRFLSMEPLLGPVNIKPYLQNNHTARCPGSPAAAWPCIDWVIVGGESGPGARPMHPDWARSLRDQCSAARVPFFFKQWGDHMPWDSQHSTDSQCASLAKKAKLHSRMMPDGTFPAGSCNKEEMDKYMSQGVHMVSVGKKAAGRLLDGREWNELPAIAEVPA